MTKSYGQYCGLARALDVVGDRWNLLVVRELLIGPARYRELLDGLPGVATNLLAGRLRDLEAAGVVERRLATEGNAVVYALTPWGAGLREPIESLVRWSAPLMARGPGDDHFRSDWLVVALRALLAGRTATDRTSTVGVTVGDQLLQMVPTSGGVEVGPRDGRPLDAVLHGDAASILGLAAGAFGLHEAPGLDVDGDAEAVRAVFGV